MAKDYGASRNTNRKSRGQSQVLLAFVCFLLGYLTASFLNIDNLSQWVNAQVHDFQGTKPEVAKAPPREATLPPKPKFEFYTLLANEKVPAKTSPLPESNPTTNPVKEATAVSTPVQPQGNETHAIQPSKTTSVTVTEQKPQPSSASPVKGSYLVQVASFKAQNDAQKMKGLLTLKGYEVSVVPISGPKGNWFRVLIGPFSNRVLAQKAQMQLSKSEHLNGMVTSAGG